MRTRQRLALGSLLGALSLILAGSSLAQTKRPRADEDLPTRVARSTKVPQGDVLKIVNALGPAIREELMNGKTVSLPGLGTFRVVQVAEHRDLRDGKPVTIPATNTIEFLATGETIAAANTTGAKPAEVVPDFRYITIPGQAPSQRVPSSRTPTIRTR
jgi:nucleoid DNA-binding protein